MQSETREERLARLTELAKKVWPEYAPAVEAWDDEVAVTDNTAGEWLAEMRQHPRSLDALEAALCVLNGEVPQWAARLAKRWQMEGLSCNVSNTPGDRLVAHVSYDHARELLEAAKGGA